MACQPLPRSCSSSTKVRCSWLSQNAQSAAVLVEREKSVAEPSLKYSGRAPHIGLSAAVFCRVSTRLRVVRSERSASSTPWNTFFSRE
ncbi:hypothetical protein D9M71_572400 [compost metagenome]